MKHLNLLLFVGIIIFLGAIPFENKKQEKKMDKNPISFKKAFFEKKNPAKSQYNLLRSKFNYVIATLDSPNSAWINEKIKDILEIDPKKTWEKALDEKANEYFNEKVFYDGNQEINISLKVLFAKKEFLVLEKISHRDNTYASGGPFYMHHDFFCFDLKNRKKLSFSNIFIKKFKANLEVIIEKYFREKLGDDIVNNLKEEWDFKNYFISNYFYFNDKGITFFYNAGQLIWPVRFQLHAIGSYTFNLFIPFSALDKCLKKEFKNRILAN